MTYTIKINTDNAAFEHGPEDELGRILMCLGQLIIDEERIPNVPIRDANGNKCGTVTVEE